MGASKNDTFKGSNLLNALKLMYYTLLLCFVKSHKSMGHNEVHKAYRELIKGMKKDFDGVLTLFAVKEDVRGRGVGKALLSKLIEYTYIPIIPVIMVFMSIWDFSVLKKNGLTFYVKIKKVNWMFICMALT